MSVAASMRTWAQPTLAALLLATSACGPNPDNYRLQAGPRLLIIPFSCVERAVGEPEAYRWAGSQTQFANFYLHTTWPDFRCVGPEPFLPWITPPSMVRYHTTYYGAHVSDQLRLDFQVFVLEEGLKTPSSCPPMYAEDGSWRPREGDCAKPYRPDASRFRRLGALAGATHFEHVNPNFYARNPGSGAPFNDVYVWGSLADPSFLLRCDRRAEVTGAHVAGAGRECVGAFAHEGFVTVMSFSQNYIPASDAQDIRSRYVKLVSDMAASGSDVKGRTGG